MFDICFGPSLELPISEDDGFVEHNVLPTDLFFFFFFVLYKIEIKILQTT